MDDPVVRLAVPEDAAGIARVHVLSWQVAYRGQIPDDYLDSLSIDHRRRAWARQLRDADDFPNQTNWVVERDGEIVGFAAVDSAAGELLAIYVLADHWGSGVGAALMNTATEFLRDRVASATLWVLDTNTRAREFYERGGWTPDGATKDDDRGSFVLHEVRYRIEF